MDLTVEGKLYLDGTIQQGCLGITNGKITQIKKIIHSQNHINFGKKLILPSATDIHVHFRDPGYTQKEDFCTGSLAAAHGGVTCIFDMPNTKPATTTVETLQEKKQIAQHKSIIDYGIYAALTDANINNVESLALLCNGFKVYMAETIQILKVNDQTIQQALPQLKNLKKLMLVHAEYPTGFQQSHRQPSSLLEHLKFRPAACEETAIQKILQWNQKIQAQIHICHLTSCEGLEALRNRPKEITVGVTPHHLFCDLKHIKSHPQWYKVNPPIRTTLDREALWNAMTNYQIDMIESDHAPHTQQEKEKDFEQAPSGMPGVETLYPLLLAEAQKNNIPLPTLIDMVCKHPAERLMVSKGQLKEGFDADFIVVDYKTSQKISAETLHSKCGWTTYQGKQGIFPCDVFLRGNHIIEDFECTVKPGTGEWIGEESQ